MKARTTAEEAVLLAEAGYATHIRVQVADSTGTLQDVSDYVTSVRYEAGLDSPVGQCTVELARSVGEVSVAPYADSPLNSPAQLLAHWRLFTLEVACAPLDTPREAVSTWREEFRGRIDDVTSGDDTVSFQGRDLGGRLQRIMINAERTYGSDAGTAVETVMNQILADNGLSSVSVYTSASPAWLLTKYKQEKVPVLDALRTLAEQLGWELRYWYNPSTGHMDRLYLYEPDRDNTTPDFIFFPDGACAYRVLSELRETGEDLRNVWVGIYSDPTDKDAAGVPKRKTVTRSDSASRAAYDDAQVEIAESSTSNIDSDAEMIRLLDSGLADCKDPKVVGSVEVPFFPWLQLGDMVGLAANDTTLSMDVVLHVEAYSHELAGGTCSTKISFRGDRPHASMRSWMRRDARPRLNPPLEVTGPNQPTGLTSAVTAGGFRIRFDPPTSGPAAKEYELHVSTSSGFTPSDATRRVVGALTEMVVTDLNPGTTYYAKVVPRDAKGNRGTASAQVTLTPRYVEPRTLAKRISYGRLPINGDWEAFNEAGGAPDNWAITSGVWGTHVLQTSDAYTGGSALRFPSSGPGVIVVLLSDLFVVRPGTLWGVSAVTKSASGGTIGYGEASIRWYDGSFANLGTGVGASLQVTSGGIWTAVSGTSVVPSAARYGRLEIQIDDYPRTVDVYVDSVTIEQVTGIEQVPSGTVSLLNGFTAASGYGAPNYFLSSNSLVYLEGAVTRASTPAAGTVIFSIISSTGFPPYNRRFAVATDTGAGVVEVQTNGDVVYLSGGVGYLSFDGISYRRS